MLTPAASSVRDMPIRVRLFSQATSRKPQTCSARGAVAVDARRGGRGFRGVSYQCNDRGMAHLVQQVADVAQHGLVLVLAVLIELDHHTQHCDLGGIDEAQRLWRGLLFTWFSVCRAGPTGQISQVEVPMDTHAWHAVLEIYGGLDE